MAVLPAINVWFSVGSTYSYLALMRLPEVAAARGVAFRLRPFNVRKIMIAMDNRFLAGKPEKYAHMWRDIARRAARYGLVAHVPVPHPIPGFDLANRVAVLAAAEGWCEAYVRETYLRWFGQGQAPGSEPNLSASLVAIGQDPTRVLALAYDAATEEARSLGIFGAPSFIVDRELFWGDDRLEDAVDWRLHGRLV